MTQLGPDGDNTADYEHTWEGSESEPNDTPGTADEFPPNGCMRGTSIGSNYDFCALGVASGQTLTAETRSTDGAGCEGDTVIHVFQANNTLVGSNDDGGVGRCSRIVLSGLATGTYYIRVSNFNPTDRFNYRIEATAGGASLAPAEDDVDDVSKE